MRRAKIHEIRNKIQGIINSIENDHRKKRKKPAESYLLDLLYVQNILEEELNVGIDKYPVVGEEVFYKGYY